MTGKKLILTIVGGALLLALVGYGVFAFVRSKKPTAGLKINATPASLIFVNNAQVGQSPYEGKFPPGEVTVKIIPTGSSDSVASYQTKVKLVDQVYTVINRDFGKTEAESAGETVSAQPQSGSSASLAVVTSSPDSASVSVDGQPQGFTPLLVSTITEGEHQIVITSPGYNPRTIAAQALSGYKLTINAKLSAQTEPTPTPTPEATPSATPLVTPGKGTPTVTPTSKTTPTATPMLSTTPAKTSPTPTPKGTSVTPTPSVPKPYVQILSTPTGFLRVRSGAGKNFSEIGQVKPGETYSLLESQNGWYSIKVDFAATSSGWISAEYAKKYE